MRVVAVLYIVLSLCANFWVGSLSTFVLATFSFPFLLWLLLRKRKKAPGENHHHKVPAQ
jgi:hypothetical protein